MVKTNSGCTKNEIALKENQFTWWQEQIRVVRNINSFRPGLAKFNLWKPISKCFGTYFKDFWPIRKALISHILYHDLTRKLVKKSPEKSHGKSHERKFSWFCIFFVLHLCKKVENVPKKANLRRHYKLVHDIALPAGKQKQTIKANAILIIHLKTKVIIWRATSSRKNALH